MGGVAAAGNAVVKKRRAASAPHYVTAHPTRADVRVTVAATGKLAGLNTVEVGAEVTGKILRIGADYNDVVRKGQLLAEIDPEQLRATVDEASAQVLTSEASIQTAKATLVETKQALARATDQAARGLVSQKDLEAAQAAEARAAAAVASSTASTSLSRASLKAAQSKLSKTKIYAPMDGVVLSRSVELGQTVTAGFTTPVLFKLADDLAKLALHVDVDEADVGRVRDGLTASFTVDAYPDRAFPSKVLSLYNEPKTSNNVVTYEAILAVDNADHALRPGLTATATITSSTLANVLTVPNAALRFVPPATGATDGPGAPAPTATTVTPAKADEKHVYVLRGGAPVLQAVRVGASDGHVTELVTPMAESEEVIVDVVQSR